VSPHRIRGRVGFVSQQRIHDFQMLADRLLLHAPRVPNSLTHNLNQFAVRRNFLGQPLVSAVLNDRFMQSAIDNPFGITPLLIVPRLVPKVLKRSLNLL
jgi:hypothetical protein